jgi:2-methylcitrate dehydratase PrpD
MTTIVEQLSAYAAGLRYQDLPQDVIHQAKRLVIDTIGCALGGCGSAPARIAGDIAGAVTSVKPATLMVSGQRTTAIPVPGNLAIRATVSPPCSLSPN